MFHHTLCQKPCLLLFSVSHLSLLLFPLCLLLRHGTALYVLRAHISGELSLTLSFNLSYRDRLREQTGLTGNHVQASMTAESPVHSTTFRSTMLMRLPEMGSYGHLSSVQVQPPKDQYLSTPVRRYSGQVSVNTEPDPLAGGPGGSGVDTIASLGETISNHTGGIYDIISWDPRGVGKFTMSVTFLCAVIRRIC